jgi:Zn-dependent M28 family amino/carboxypeptidase
MAFIPGSQFKDEYVVFSAHYDHLGIQDGKIYYGADDDGSGTVAVLELAQAFYESYKNGNGPKRNVLFINFSGEEKGLLGSEYYSKNPIVPLNQTVCDLNIDMIGRLDKEHENNPNYVYIIGSDKLSSDLHFINEEANKKSVNILLDYTYNKPSDPNRFYYRSDHYNFAKNNIPVIFYFTGVHADYHKPTDTVDKIDFNKMEKITRLIFYTAWDIANRNERIKVDKVNDFKSNR